MEKFPNTDIGGQRFETPENAKSGVTPSQNFMDHWTKPRFKDQDTVEVLTDPESTIKKLRIEAKKSGQGILITFYSGDFEIASKWMSLELYLKLSGKGEEQILEALAMSYKSLFNKVRYRPYNMIPVLAMASYEAIETLLERRTNP